MRYHLALKNERLRIILALIFSLTSFNSHAFNAGESRHSTSANSSSQHISNMDELMTRKPNPDVTVNGVGIYVYDGMYSLDALGPFQVFKSAALKPFPASTISGLVTPLAASLTSP